ncbi:MAG: hypothetical protein SCJ94_04805 [Bacillota bacterium]|nr:hypothetical protein [Bacillota bacterium]
MEESVIQVFETAPWIIFFAIVFFLFIIATGFFFSKKIGTTEDLVLAGRSLSLPYLVASAVATYICAGAVIGAAGAAYGAGFQGVIFDPFSIALITFPLIAIFFAYPLRQARYITVVDYYNIRYSKTMGTLYLIIQSLSIISWFGGQLVAFGIIISLTTGVNMTVAVIIATLIIIIVTYLGGLWALSRVDLFAVIFLILTLLIMLPFVMNQVGGFSSFFANAENYAELPTFALWPVAEEAGGYLWYTGIFGLFYYLSAWIAFGLGGLNCPVALQRALAAKSSRVARQGFAISGAIYLLIGVIPVLVGIAMYTYGVDLPVDQQEMVLPLAAELFLPPWLSVAFILTLVVAIISTVGDSVLTAATILGHNVYGYYRPQSTTEEQLKVIRILIPVIAIVGMIIALSLGNVYRLIIFAGAIVLATVIAPYIFGFYWKKSNNYGSIAAFFSGIVSWIVAFLIFLPYTKEANMGIIVEGQVYMDWALWDAVFMALIPAFAVAVAAQIGISLVTQKSDPAKPLADVDGRPLERKGITFYSEDENMRNIK